MRLKSEVWVKAFVRRCNASGAFAAVVRHGDDDAGAIFIKINRLDGTAGLYGPAPAGFGGDGEDRSWSAHIDRADARERDVDAYLARQAEFDSDLWIIEVEDRAGRHFLEGWITA
jgi:hypothetical protein